MSAWQRSRLTALTAEQSITQHSNTKGRVARFPSAFQDVGACMGQDTRRLLTDGWGQHQIIALDLVADYWYDTSLLQCYNTGRETSAEKAYSCCSTMICLGSSRLYLVQLNLQNLCLCSVAQSWSHTGLTQQ